MIPPYTMASFNVPILRRYHNKQYFYITYTDLYTNKYRLYPIKILSFDFRTKFWCVSFKCKDNFILRLSRKAIVFVGLAERTWPFSLENAERRVHGTSGRHKSNLTSKDIFPKRIVNIFDLFSPGNETKPQIPVN